MKEAEHIKGFEDEVYWVTHGGTTPLDVKLALRPTSETAIYPMYALWLRSHADLPMKYYQIVNTFRYETKQTRPLIRLREITSFMESHTVHATWDEAEAQVEYELGLTTEFYDGLCIPITISRARTGTSSPALTTPLQWTRSCRTARPSRSARCTTLAHTSRRPLPSSSRTRTGSSRLANQTCYGISERCIAALISMHGDDKGLILPPAVAPVQAVIVPITIGKRHEDVLAAAKKLESTLKAAGFRVKMDTRDMRPGAKYYWWELRGVPLRLELGPRDLDGGKVMAVKRTGEKCSLELATVTEGITTVFAEITDAIRARAEEHTKTHLCSVDSMDGLNAALNDGKVAVIHWCRGRECGDAIEDKANSSILGTDVRSPYVPCTDGCCIVCGRPGKATLVGRTY